MKAAFDSIQNHKLGRLERGSFISKTFRPLEARILRNKSAFFDALSSFISNGESTAQKGSLVKLNYFRRWRRRFVQRNCLKQRIQRLCDSANQIQKDGRKRYKEMAFYWMKANMQEWKVKTVLCRALLERQDFRRIRSFKILQNFAKVSRLFFKVVIGCVLRKEHLNKKVTIMKLKKESRAYEWETQRRALGVLDLLRIQKNAYHTKTEKPILSILSRKPHKLFTIFHKLKTLSITKNESDSENDIFQMLQRCETLKSKEIHDNPVLMTMLLTSILRASIYAKKRVLQRSMRKLQLLTILKRRDTDRSALSVLTISLQNMRHRPAECLSTLVLSTRHSSISDSLSKFQALDRQIFSGLRSLDALRVEAAESYRRVTSSKYRSIIYRLMVDKLTVALTAMRRWLLVDSVNQCKMNQKNARLTFVFKALLLRRLRNGFGRILRAGFRQKKEEEFVRRMKRKSLKSGFRAWAASSKKGAGLLRKAFVKIEEALNLDVLHTMRKLRLNVTGNKSKNLLDQIELLNENISEANGELLSQTQENFKLENEIRKRSVRSQASLIRFLQRSSEKKRLLEMRMCLFHLANFSNYSRKATFLLSAIHRACVRVEATAFYLLERESIVDQEKYLVQQVKNFRDDTAEAMIEREELNQQTLAFVEDRTTFEISTEVLSKRISIASEEAAIRALRRARKVEERAVMRMRLKMWQGRRRRLELIRAFMDRESSEFAIRKRKRALRLWKNQIKKVKFFKKGFHELIRFVGEKSMKLKGLGFRITGDRSFEMEQFQLGRLVEQAQKKIASAAEEDLRSRLFRITSSILKLIENRKYNQFMRFFEVTILHPKKKLVSNIRGQPLAERIKLQLLSKYFKLYRQKYQATQKRKQLEERRVNRQKLYMFKLLEVNIKLGRQTRLSCSFFDHIFNSIDNSRLAESFKTLSTMYKPLARPSRLAQGVRFIEMLNNIISRKLILLNKQILQKLMLPKPEVGPLSSVLSSLTRRKLQLTFDLTKNAARADNLIGRYLVAPLRPMQPRSDTGLLQTAFEAWRTRSSRASRKWRAASKIHGLLDRPLTTAVAIKSWRHLLKFDRIELSSRNPEDAYRR